MLLLYIIIKLATFLFERVVATMWFLFAVITLLIEWYALTEIAKTPSGKKLSARLQQSFWQCYAVFCIAFPLVSLVVLLVAGAHPHWACCAAGTVMIGNGIFTGIFQDTGVEMPEFRSQR